VPSTVFAPFTAREGGVVHDADPAGTHALDAAREIRALIPAGGTRLLVGGDSATTLDERTSC
jgi:hypothetical protein